MQKYANTNGDSGVESFEIHESYIIVKFKGTYRTYKYSYQSAGQSHVETMKQLALAGNGLNAYIKHHVNSKYVR
jgi:macrodomain Ter protein organizer (MatP/YcbG family)